MAGDWPFRRTIPARSCSFKRTSHDWAGRSRVHDGNRKMARDHLRYRCCDHIHILARYVRDTRGFGCPAGKPVHPRYIRFSVVFDDKLSDIQGNSSPGNLSDGLLHRAGEMPVLQPHCRGYYVQGYTTPLSPAAQKEPAFFQLQKMQSEATLFARVILQGYGVLHKTPITCGTKATITHPHILRGG
jgi:hypothetical protein